MAINVKCGKCGETGTRKNQVELAESRKCKVCGGVLEIQKGSVMDVPIESIVKSGIGKAKDIIKKKQDTSREKAESLYNRMQTTLDAILEENKKHTTQMNELLKKLGMGSA